MNSKKRLIPIVAIAALVLSLVVVFPAFGQGTASFIVPGDINDVNDGSLSDSTPDEQTYGKQDGKVGLYLDDDSLDYPIRRVLIPEMGDLNEYDAMVTYKAHDNKIMVDAGEAAANEFIVVGDDTARKVSSVKAYEHPGNTNTAWTLRNDTEVKAADAAKLPTFELTGLETGAGGAIAVAIAITADPTGVDLPGQLDFTAKSTRTSGDTDLNNANLENADSLNPAQHNGTVTIGATVTTTGSGNDADDALSESDLAAATGTYTVKFTLTTGSSDDNDLITRTHTLTINIVDPLDEVTLDRPFAVDSLEAGEKAYEVNLTDTEKTAANWSSNYSHYAMAIRLHSSEDTANVNLSNGDLRYRDKEGHIIAASNIADTPSGSANATKRVGETEHRITGNESGRVNTNDVLVVTFNYDADASPAQTPTSIKASNLTGDAQSVALDTVRDEDVTWTTPNLNTTTTDYYVYLAAWFEEKNDTGATVSIRSQAYQKKTTVVMQETEDESGRFALRIDAQPYGTATNEYAMTDTEPDVPILPVNERDVITLASSDSSATLRIETTSPSFTGLSPAHNFAGEDSRPTVSAQVTDGDSGLDEGAIDILFRITANNASVPEIVNPKADADTSEISGGYEVSARLGDGGDNTVVPTGDATIEWWVRAVDKAGNVGFSDRVASDDDGPNPCKATEKDTALSALENLDCQPYVIHVDGTDPKLLRAETGRHWNSALTTGDSKDKTEYRVTKANAKSVLVVFSEHLDPSSVSANDFEVNGSTPVDASPRNVKVRNDVDNGSDTFDGNAKIAGDPEDVGLTRGYVFLTLSSDLNASAEPKVQLVGEVLDLAGNEQDSGTDNDALDRIAPTLTVTIDEGARPATMDKVNITITSDENIGSPTVMAKQVFSSDGKAMVNSDSDDITGTVKFVSATEYTAEVAAGNDDDGLYTIHVEATDAAGGNKGSTGAMSGDDLDVSSDTKLILFEHDENIGKPDVDADNPGIDDTFTIDDPNTYIRIDFSEEAREYDNEMYQLSPTATPLPAEVKGDDLDTHGGVTIVSATLGDMDITDALQANPAGNVFLYKATDLALGDHKLEIVAQDAAGNKHATAEEATITIEERKPYSLSLNPGWNLVSIPGEPADSDINVVIPADRSDITSVLAFDPTVPGMWLSATRGADGMFAGTLKNVISTRAYWVETNSFTALKVSIPKQSAGAARILPTINLAKGWNMVPVLDIDGDFEMTDAEKAEYFTQLGTPGTEWRAYTFNTITNKWESKTSVELGVGYWVYVAKAAVIVP